MCLMFRELILVFLLLSILISKSANADDDVETVEIDIKTEDDKTTRIIGTKQKDWLDGEYLAFRGMPYVKPPIGDLRFKEPQELDTLPPLIDARYDGHDCPSVSATNASEDCLVLNVYTKDLSPARPMPVVFFIHAGGLWESSALSTVVNPSYLLTKPMVLVSFNYRLAVLGLLSLGTKHIPGNAGFKDQVCALRWVKKYIAHFGGDVNDVTLMGYSAGGFSVSLHLTSPMSKGFFHRAILMSGVLQPQADLTQAAAIVSAVRQAEALNCSDLYGGSAVNVSQILHCLNEFSGSQIAATAPSLTVIGSYTPLYPWLPTLEHDFGQTRFLSQDIFELIENGDFERVPLLIGFNDGEFCNVAGEIFHEEQLRKRFYAEFESLAPFLFLFGNTTNMRSIAKSIEHHYTGEVIGDDWDLEHLCNAISDAVIRFGAYRLSKLAAKYVDVYNYKFAYKGAFTYFNYKVDNPRAEHLDDASYIFPLRQQRKIQPTDRDAQMVKLYTNFFWDFITNGKTQANSL